MVSADNNRPTLFDRQVARDAIEWILVSAVTSDRRVNTRPVDPAWVEKKLREGFDPTQIGVPIVSSRQDGTMVWLDGQNRAELIRRAGWSDQKIQCRVFYGLTIAEEARAFLVHNDNRTIRPIYKFLARVTSGDEAAVAITTIAKAAGWRIQDGAANQGITASRSLEKVYLATPKSPGRALFPTLRVITEAWGYKPTTVNGHVIEGIGMVFARFDDAIEIPALVKKLAEYPGGPSGLIGKAKGLREYQGGILAHSVAEIVVTTYNVRRRGGALPDWR